jgi:drug/metabolite transporter (DMT)-like permease
MIIASVPIVSVIAGCTLFKEKVTFVNVLGILVTLAGILLVLSSQGEDCKGGNFVLGLVLLVLAVFAEVGHASMTKFLSGDYKPQVIAMYQFLIGSVYLLPFFIFKGLDGFEVRYLSWQVLRPILFLALLCSSLAFSLWAMTIKKLGVAKSSVFLATMCIATALVAELIGREHMVLIQWLGIGVAVLGIILSQMSACNREGQGSR